MKCIYCLKTNNEVSFLKREHVVPKLMGGFDNNPVLSNLVCDICNSKVFGPLESKFKEDTVEGLRFQMVNFNNDSQVRVSAEKVVRRITQGFKEELFNEMFPFLKWQNGSFKIVPIPQIKIKNEGTNGYTILLYDKWKDIDRTSSKFLSLKSRFGKTKSTDVSIFVGYNGVDGNSEMEEAIKFVREIGIDYKEGKRKSVDQNDTTGTYIETELDATVNNDVGRVISKIAFNYFAFCAKKDNKENILYHQNFNKIKEYILGVKSFPIKEIIPEMHFEPIIYDEKIGGGRLAGHMVSFRQEGNYLISELSFLGGNIYKVILGEIPTELKNKNCGCGHLFNPINKEIKQLTLNQAKWGSDIEEGWGLFRIS